MMLLVNFDAQDRLALLRSWVQHDGNANACEAQVVLEKKKSTKLDRDRELLKVSDMVKRGFSEMLMMQFNIKMCVPNSGG